MNTNDWANAGGKKPTAPGMENIPPALVADLPTTPKAPAFPKKRPRSTSHYTGGDCSPSKRRDLGTYKSVKVLPDERSPLFGDATNSCPKHLENEGEAPIIAKLKTTGQGRVKKGGSKKRMKMEVMIPIKNRRLIQPELGTDVQVDVFN